MALLGIDIETPGARAPHGLEQRTLYPCRYERRRQPAPPLAWRHSRARQGDLVLSESIGAFGYWAEQLLAESTGKEGKGLVPVESEALGAPEVYGPDRVFVWMRTADSTDATVEAKLAALEKAGHPVVRLVLHDALDLGAEFLRWELATATAGASSS